MAKNGNKIKAILDLLTAELSAGILYLQIASTLHAKYAHSDLLASPCLLSMTYQACFNQVVLSLARLGIHERESVSIEYLLNCAWQNTKAFRFTDRQELEGQIKTHRQLLLEKGPFLEKVKALRDRMLAHLDRKHINEPEIISTLQIQFDQIEQTFETFLQILNYYKESYDSTQIDLSTSKQMLREDIARLVACAEDILE
jgi:hypothetical protein